MTVGWINEKKLNCSENTISLKTQVQEVVEVQKSDRVCQVMTSVVEICDNYLQVLTFQCLARLICPTSSDWMLEMQIQRQRGVN